MPDFFLSITSFSGCGCQPRKPSVRSFKISWNLPPAQITASSGTPSSLRRPSGRPHSVPSSWLALARWGCCPEWDRALPEKQLEGGEREREGQETGLAEGGGGQLRGAGTARGGCPRLPAGDRACGWWLVARPAGDDPLPGVVPTIRAQTGSVWKPQAARLLPTKGLGAELPAGCPTGLGHHLPPPTGMPFLA